MHKISPRHFLKNQTEAYLWIKSLRFLLQFVLNVCASEGLAKYIQNKVLNNCLYLNVFQNQKNLVSLFHFLAEFWRKIFLTLYSVNWPDFAVSLRYLVFLLLEILGIMCIAIVSFPVDDVINFETNISFIIRFPTWPKKSGPKI